MGLQSLTNSAIDLVVSQIDIAELTFSESGESIKDREFVIRVQLAFILISVKYSPVADDTVMYLLMTSKVMNRINYIQQIILILCTSSNYAGEAICARLAKLKDMKRALN